MKDTESYGSDENFIIDNDRIYFLKRTNDPEREVNYIAGLRSINLDGSNLIDYSGITPYQ